MVSSWSAWGSISSMKVSVSLPDEDVAFLDAYAEAHRLDSRSAALQEAVRVLRYGDLEGAYAAAWEDWSRADDAALWASTDADALGDR